MVLLRRQHSYHLRLKVAEPYSNYACRLEIAALSVVAQFGQGQIGR